MRRVTHCALRAPFKQTRRVSSRSMRVLRHACHPATAPPQAQPEGMGAMTRAIAALGLDFAARGACARERGPSAAMARVAGFPSVCAEERSGRGAHARRSAHASCTDLPQLFERSAQRAVSSAAPPAREHRRLPVAKRRDADSRVAFLLGTFLWRDKEKYLARRGEIPASAPQPLSRR